MDEKPRERRTLWRLPLLVLAALLIATVALALFGRPAGRIEGVVTQAGRPVPGARVMAMVSLSNVGTTWSIPLLRPREVVVRADSEGRYVVEHARTDVILGVFALPPAGPPAGIAMADVRAVAGETIRLDLSLGQRARPGVR